MTKQVEFFRRSISVTDQHDELINLAATRLPGIGTASGVVRRALEQFFADPKIQAQLEQQL